MKKLLTMLVILCCATQTVARNNSDNSISVFIIDNTPTNVREQPNGKIAGKLPVIDTGYIVELDECQKGWCSVIDIREAAEDKEIKIKSTTGKLWLHHSVLGFHTRNYGKQKITIRNKPQNNAPAVYSFNEEQSLCLLDFNDNWAKVKTWDSKHTGWIERKWVCENPLTTCS